MINLIDVIQRSSCEFSDKQMSTIFEESLANKKWYKFEEFLANFWMNEVDYFVSSTRR